MTYKKFYSWKCETIKDNRIPMEMWVDCNSGAFNIFESEEEALGAINWDEVNYHTLTLRTQFTNAK